MTTDNNDPIREIVLEGDGLQQLDYGFRRVGGKRNDWWQKGVQYHWNIIKTKLPPHLRYARFDEQNQEHQQHIERAAQQGLGTRREQPPRIQHVPPHVRQVPRQTAQVTFLRGPNLSVNDHR